MSCQNRFLTKYQFAKSRPSAIIKRGKNVLVDLKAKLGYYYICRSEKDDLVSTDISTIPKKLN